jgi:hypothetical protein
MADPTTCCKRPTRRTGKLSNDRAVPADQEVLGRRDANIEFLRGGTWEERSGALMNRQKQTKSPDDWSGSPASPCRIFVLNRIVTGDLHPCPSRPKSQSAAHPREVPRGSIHHRCGLRCGQPRCMSEKTHSQAEGPDLSPKRECHNVTDGSQCDTSQKDSLL